MYRDLDDLEEIGSHYFFKFFSIDRRRTERERNNFDFRTGRGGEKLLRPVTGLRAVLLRSAKKSRKRYHTRIDSSLLVWHEVLRSMCAATCVIQRGILWSHLHTEFVPKVRRLGQPRHVFTSSNRAALIVFNTFRFPSPSLSLPQRQQFRESRTTYYLYTYDRRRWIFSRRRFQFVIKKRKIHRVTTRIYITI